MNNDGIRDRKVKQNFSINIDNDNYIINSISRKPFLSLFLSCLFPGIGQIYNGQVTKGILFFLFFYIFFGGSLIYIITLIIHSIFGFMWFYILLNIPILFYNIVNVFNLCSSSQESSLLCNIQEYIIIFYTSIYNYITIFITRFFSIIFSFPPPPLSSLLIHMLRMLFDFHFIFLMFLFILIGLFYCYQVYDSYISAIKINSGKLLIKRTRKSQFIELISVNFLPYLLLLLPIPYISEIVSICFASSKTITDLIDTIENPNIKTNLSPTTIIWNQVKALLYNELTNFLIYSFVILIILIYLIWYIILIIQWLCILIGLL